MKKPTLVMLSFLVVSIVMGCDNQEDTKQINRSGQANESKAHIPETERISGIIDNKSNFLLPKEAIITITLSDVSLMDVPAKLISQEVLTEPKSSFPIHYSLKYVPATIRHNHRYAVRADIRIDGKLRFVTDRNYPVITDKKHTKVQYLLVKKVNK